MKHLLILGASGQIARWVVRALEDRQDTSLTLLVRKPYFM